MTVKTNQTAQMVCLHLPHRLSFSCITLDKALFQPKTDIFFLFLHENMLWVLIRSASVRHF